MNVYVESNFVLELALLQEQSASGEAILRLGEERRVHLVVPAYALVEPYETLTRRHKQRREMKKDFDVELGQLARTATYTDRLNGLRDLTALLIQSADEAERRLEEVRSRLLNTAEVIPLDAAVLAASAAPRREHGLSPQDALVYAAVLSHLQRVRPAQSCFLNRDSKDFNDPHIVEQLGRYSCKLFPRFDSGHQFILNALR